MTPEQKESLITSLVAALDGVIKYAPMLQDMSAAR